MQAIEELTSDQTVAAALERVMGRVEEGPRGSWRLASARPGLATLRARCAGEWLELRMAAANGCLHDEAVVRSAWETLERNSLLPGGAKLLLGRGSRVIELGAELPLFDRKCGLERALNRCVGELLRASVQLKSGVVARHSAGAAKARRLPACPGQWLGALCAEVGWDFHPRGEEKIAAPLELREGFVQAVVQCDGEVRARVELPVPEKLSAESRNAIGVLLLSIGGLVRSVRPLVGGAGGLLTPGLEVCLGRRPESSDLAQALSALSVAVNLCAAEVAALGNETVAKEFLAMRGWSLPLPEAQ